jgi:MFS family permease
MNDATVRSPPGSMPPDGPPLEFDQGAAEQTAGALDEVLVDAKLSVPLPRSGVVPRSQLIERARASGCQVVGVSAPAGYGKTTLLVEWALTEDRAVGWVSLDRFDDDPRLLLPAMQSLIHGNFEGAAQKRVYALVGAAAAIAAAVGPLLGGFITTYLSWRVGFLLEAVIIAIVLSGVGRVRDVPYTGPRGIDSVGAVLSVFGMGGIVLSILVWQEGGEAVGALLVIGAASLAALAYWLVERRRRGKLTLLDPDLFRSKHFRIGISQQMMQQIALGGAMITLPIFLQMVLEYNAMQTGLSLAPLSLSMFGTTMLAAKKAGDRRPSSIIRVGFALLAIGMVATRGPAPFSSPSSCRSSPGSSG